MDAIQEVRTNMVKFQRTINFQCKKIAPDVKKSTAQGKTITSQIDFIDNDANKDLNFRLSVSGHPDHVKGFMNDVSIDDVDQLFETNMKFIPKVKQTKLLEEKEVSKEVAEEDKIDSDNIAEPYDLSDDLDD